MGFLKKLFGQGKGSSSPKEQSKPSAAHKTKISTTDNTFVDSANKLQKNIEQNMAILRYLCTCGKLDQDKLTTYFSMADQVGMQWPSNDRQTMLNATLNFAPKRASDGTVMNGFEQVRVMLIESHAKGVSQNLKLFNALIPLLPKDETILKPAATFLQQVVADIKELELSKFIG
jgi:hypothetical protein